MTPIGFDMHWDQPFADQYKVTRCSTVHDLLRQADVVSLHLNLSDLTRGMINRDSLAMMKDGAILVNTARGGLVVEADIAEACKSGKLRGYAADVLETEPIKTPHPFQEIDNIMITPHVGSRTYESVQRQGLRAAMNLVNYLNGHKDYVQANPFF
jgi:D-3-phosphoglycerate dehydrogenase